VHLAQGLVVNGPARRAEFVANLRQHLQNLPAHEQVALSIQRSVRDGNGRISLQLSPAELGRVNVRLDIDDDNRVQATVTVERPATLDLLQRDIRALERALQEAGLKTDSDSLSLNLTNGRGDGFDRDMASSGNGGNSPGTGNVAAEGEETAQSMLKTAIVATAEGLIDVEI
jgi:flagellar hook-length control protein FliK